MAESLDRCQVVPLADHQVEFRVEGRPRVRWHYDARYPRPFLFPLLGPGGSELTRMGHPGAPDHDHHRSAWFAHQKLLGIDFWSDQTAARIRQIQWLVYEDGAEQATMAVRLGWYDGHDPAPLVEQELVVGVGPVPEQPEESLVELQATFVPRSERLEFGQTNFGFLAVRLARSISEHFGGGRLTSSQGREGEPENFGQPAAWMDYSGPVRRADGAVDRGGITYFDHPDNPGFPNRWHVRADGWMGVSACRTGPLETRRDQPLRLRYLLHLHGGGLARDRAEAQAARFGGQRAWLVEPSQRPHRQFQLSRTG